MNKKVFYILLLALGLGAPHFASADFEIGKTMYLKHGFHAERGKSYTTNYRAGMCIPRGSKVTVIKVGRKYADLLVDHYGIGKVRLTNPKKHSKMDTESYLNRMLSKKPVGFKKFAKDQRSNIESCRVVPGMTKKEVIASLGYPPKHVTPSTEMNQWKYWKKRFNTEMLYFTDNRLKAIED